MPGGKEHSKQTPWALEWTWKPGLEPGQFSVPPILQVCKEGTKRKMYAQHKQSAETFPLLTSMSLNGPRAQWEVREPCRKGRHPALPLTSCLASTHILLPLPRCGRIHGTTHVCPPSTKACSNEQLQTPPSRRRHNISFGHELTLSPEWGHL